MESLSRPFHRRKLSNANSFSGKNAYDGVFSGHRPKFDGVPAVNVEEYREIFSSGQAASSIPVLDLSSLQESSDGSILELGSSKPDYGKIFGGFRDEDIAVPYEELLARDKARVPMSSSNNSQDLHDDLSHEFDAMKQFNMSYHKISQTNKAGKDGTTTHVTQLHVVPGFTCFIDESASQPKKETKKQKSVTPNKVHSPEKQTSQSGVESKSKFHQDDKKTDVKSHSSKISSPKKEIEKQKSQIGVECESKYHQDDEKVNLKLHNSKVSTFYTNSTIKNEAVSQPKVEIEKKNLSEKDDVHLINSMKRDFLEKKTSQSGVEPKSKYHEDNEKVNLKSHNFKVSSLNTNSTINNEAVSQPKMETKKKKSFETDNVHTINSIKEDFLEKKTSESGVESKRKDHQDESLSDDKKIDLKSHNSKVSSSSTSTNGEPIIQSKKETHKKKSSETDNVHTINSIKEDFLEKKTSQSGVESKRKDHQDESLSDDKKIHLKSQNSKVSSSSSSSLPSTNGEPIIQSKKETHTKKSSETVDDFLEKQTSVESLSNDRISKKFEADINLHPSSSSSTSETNVDDNKDYEKGTTFTNTWTWKNETHGEFSSTCFDEELDVNSIAGASTAALRKAIEKAQESIRIAKESIGKKKEGLKSFSTKSFKDSLKVKTRVENISINEEQKEKENWIKEIFKARMANVNASQVSSNVDLDHKHKEKVVFEESRNGENLFGVKKVINEKIVEKEKKFEMPIESCNELKDDKVVCDSKEVLSEPKDVENERMSFEEVENDTNESLKEDNQKPNGFFVLESCENKVEDIEDTIKDEKHVELMENKDEVGVGPSEETNNLTLYKNVEDEKKVSHDCDENSYEVRFDDSLGLLENIKKEVLEQEHNEEIISEKSNESNSDDEESEKVVEDEKEVKEESETESQTEDDNTGDMFYDVNDVEIIETSSSDYDDAEEIESIHGCKADQSDSNVESSQEDDDVSNISPQVIKEEHTEEKETSENVSVDEIASEDNDDMSCNRIADVDETERKDEQPESCSDTMVNMEIEIKECKESEETIKKEEEEEKDDNTLHESDSERPEIVSEMETGTSQESNDENVIKKDENGSKEKEKNEEKERAKRDRIAVERLIREVRERAFNEARERAASERANAMKASENNSKMKSERAAVERATAEARQRALEKAMSQKKVSEVPRTEVNGVRGTSSDLHVLNGTSGESVQRSKAILEKDNRVKERVAKALAEKEKRDQLVQEEQAERSRISDNLDAEIKRWSTGKEGNLRALLSTLQYILGSESGWQSVSLTEIITTNAVKKAYRKATLCVHPDKLQQRGASIQQKYICEKVFDLLKAAWNRFNSEER